MPSAASGPGHSPASGPGHSPASGPAAPRRRIRVTHRPSGTVLADGPKGWGMTPFEGNVYVGRKWLRTRAFRPNWVPGLCPYKFLYVWLDLRLPGEEPVRFAGWLYWLPNPLLPFIAFRVAVARDHPALAVEEYEGGG